MKVTIDAARCDRCGAKALRQENGACIWLKGKRLMAGCSAYTIARIDTPPKVMHLCALCTAEGLQGMPA